MACLGQRALERTVCSAVGEWRTLQMPSSPALLSRLRPSLLSLVFWLAVLHITGRALLKYSTLFVELPSSTLHSVFATCVLFCFVLFGFLLSTLNEIFLEMRLITIHF